MSLDLSSGDLNSTVASSVTELRRHTCVDIDECEKYSTHECTQTCENRKGTYACKCAPNYIDTHGDGTICEATWKDDSIVLIAYGAEIRQVRQNLSEYAYNTMIEGASFVLAMDVDPLERHVYWIDAGESPQRIKRAFMPVSKAALGYAQTILGGESSMDYTAIAVDWLAKNVYYAEGRTRTIRVCKSDGRYAKTLITRYAVRVNSLVVNPILGYVAFNACLSFVFALEKVEYWLSSAARPRE